MVLSIMRTTTRPKNILLLCFLCFWAQQSARSFVVVVPTRTIRLSMSLGSNNKVPPTTPKEVECCDFGVNRRSFFSSTAKIATGTIIATTLTNPLPASAAKKEPITRENIDAAFADIRSELEDENFVELGKGGGVKFLTKLIENEEYDKVLEFTKFYDLECRKAKMGRARKLMTGDSQMTYDAVMLSNAVTFDLIGINRACRVKDKDEALKYLGELKADMGKFLDFQNQVVIPEEE